MAKQDLPELMSVRDIAIWLRKSPKAVRTMHERGQLPRAIRHPGIRVLRWRRQDLAEWLLQTSNAGQ